MFAPLFDEQFVPAKASTINKKAPNIKLFLQSHGSMERTMRKSAGENGTAAFYALMLCSARSIFGNIE
jgi:hypothetical protein